MTTSNINAPIMLFVFNRPDKLKQILDVLKKVKPSHLFLVSDAPRIDKDNETSLVQNSRNLFENIPWKCNVVKLYNKSNLGLYKTMWAAFDKIFQDFDRVIVLEDDVLPSESFFYFVDSLLEKYRNDERIQQISGMNVLDQYPKNFDFSYFFSKETSIWGFGFWKRVYNQFDRLHTYGNNSQLLNNLKLSVSKKQFTKIHNYITTGKSNYHEAGLEYFFGLHKYIYSSIAVIPTFNLISNIGCDAVSQHENSYLTMPNRIKRLYFSKTYDIGHKFTENPFVINDVIYARKILYLTGNNSNFQMFLDKIIKFFKILRYEGISGLKNKITKIIRNRKGL
jgi:hypothetical protein